MFSMSTMASSTTAPRAMIKPARTIVLIVVCRQASTIIAAISDSGMVITLISALRQSNRNSSSTTSTRIEPTISDSVRLSIEVWT